MKKLSWKNVAAGKLVAAACGAGLLLFTMSAGAGLITFDNLGGSIPEGFDNLQWSNFDVLDGLTYAGGSSGYRVGVISKPDVAYNGFGSPASISSVSSSFTPVLAYLTAAWNDKLKVQVIGYLNGRQVFSRTYTLSATKATLVVFGVKVDELDFSSSGGTLHKGYDGSGTHFAMDNFLVLP